MSNNYDEWEPEPYTYSWQEIILLVVLISVILLEFKTMWTWCQWFTNCPGG